MNAFFAQGLKLGSLVFCADVYIIDNLDEKRPPVKSLHAKNATCHVRDNAPTFWCK